MQFTDRATLYKANPDGTYSLLQDNVPFNLHVKLTEVRPPVQGQSANPSSQSAKAFFGTDLYGVVEYQVLVKDQRGRYWLVAVTPAMREKFAATAHIVTWLNLVSGRDVPTIVPQNV